MYIISLHLFIYIYTGDYTHLHSHVTIFLYGCTAPTQQNVYNYKTICLYNYIPMYLVALISVSMSVRPPAHALHIARSGFGWPPCVLKDWIQSDEPESFHSLSSSVSGYDTELLELRSFSGSVSAYGARAAPYPDTEHATRTPPRAVRGGLYRHSRPGPPSRGAAARAPPAAGRGRNGRRSRPLGHGVPYINIYIYIYIYIYSVCVCVCL